MRRGSFNLTATLAVAAIADLVLHRLIEQLFLPSQPMGAARAAAELNRFAFHLDGVLSLVLVIMSLVSALRRGQLFPASMRFAVTPVALVFTVFATIDILSLSLPEWIAIYLKTSHAFLS